MTCESQRLETLAGIIRLLAFVQTTRLTGGYGLYRLLLRRSIRLPWEALTPATSGSGRIPLSSPSLGFRGRAAALRRRPSRARGAPPPGTP